MITLCFPLKSLSTSYHPAWTTCWWSLGRTRSRARSSSTPTRRSRWLSRNDFSYHQCEYCYSRVMTPDFRWVTWSASTWSGWRTEGWDLTEPGHLAGFSQQCNQCNLLDQSLALRTKASPKLRCGRIRGQSFGEAEAFDWKSGKLWGSPDWVSEQTLNLLKRLILGKEEWLLPDYIWLDILTTFPIIHFHVVFLTF